jgi:hypothetical protein
MVTAVMVMMMMMMMMMMIIIVIDDDDKACRTALLFGRVVVDVDGDGGHGDLLLLHGVRQAVHQRERHVHLLTSQSPSR